MRITTEMGKSQYAQAPEPRLYIDGEAAWDYRIVDAVLWRIAARVSLWSRTGLPGGRPACWAIVVGKGYLHIETAGVTDEEASAAMKMLDAIAENARKEMF